MYDETLKEFDHAFRAKTDEEKKRLATKCCFLLREIAKKYENSISDILPPETLSNVVLARKKEIVELFLSRQLSGLKYEDILGLEIATNFYAKTLYKEAAIVAIGKKDYPTLSACINNLVNWGYHKEAIEIVKTIEDSDDLPKSLQDMIRLATPKIPNC